MPSSLIRFAATGLIAFTLTLSAQDGAALYRQRCQCCHGAKGVGRANQKGTDLLTDKAKGAADADMVNVILTGNGKASHAFDRRGVTKEQAEALVKHIRTLQGK